MFQALQYNGQYAANDGKVRQQFRRCDKRKDQTARGREKEDRHASIPHASSVSAIFPL